MRLSRYWEEYQNAKKKERESRLLYESRTTVEVERVETQSLMAICPRLRAVPLRLDLDRPYQPGRWPTQALFWLEWMFQSSHSVIPTEADHRGSGGLRSGEPALSEVEGDCCGYDIPGCANARRIRSGPGFELAGTTNKVGVLDKSEGGVKDKTILVFS
jgi:hypothetical protein